MSEFKGTPGPWTAVDKRPHSDGFSVFSNDQYIAFVGDSDGATNYKDNANLIAAAPELLEALQEIREEMKAFRHVANEVGINDADGIYLGHTKEIFDKASAAIAKALGQ